MVPELCYSCRSVHLWRSMPSMMNRQIPPQTIGKAIEIAPIMEARLTSKNKGKPHSITNPRLVGVPVVAYEDYRDILVNNDYVVVRMDQDGSVSEKITRSVQEVVSPGTSLTVYNLNHIMSVYIYGSSKNLRPEHTSIILAISVIEVASGKNYVYESYSRDIDPICPLQDLYRYVLRFLPKEMVVYLSKLPEEYPEYLVKFIPVSASTNLIIRGTPDPAFLNINYQEQFLNKVFHPGVLKFNTPNLLFEHLGLERKYYGCVSYLLLLQFVYEHNELLIDKIEPPIVEDEESLNLSHNCIMQLELAQGVGGGGGGGSKYKTNSCLLDLLDDTCSPMGRRYLKRKLLNPMRSGIEEWYDLTDQIMKSDVSFIRSNLKELVDIERYNRKLLLRKISPSELAGLYESYQRILSLIDKVDFLKLEDLAVNELKIALSNISGTFDIDLLAKSEIEDKRLVASDLHVLVADIAEYKRLVKDIEGIEFYLTEVQTQMNAMIGCSLIKRDAEGFFTTEAKGKILASKMEVKLVSSPKGVMIRYDELDNRFELLRRNTEAAQQYLYVVYMAILGDLESHPFYSEVAEWVSRLDYIQSNACLAKKYKYYRPRVEGGGGEGEGEGGSHLKVKELRHPLVERIINSQYVANDVELNYNQTGGLLLYGVNAAGKTVLTKSVAIAVIMAQAGMFVAGHMEYTPFSRIVTRLSGNDDLLAGQSTFVVELSE